MMHEHHTRAQGSRSRQGTAAREGGPTRDNEPARPGGHSIDLVDSCIKEALSRPHYCRSYADWAHVVLYGCSDAREHVLVLVDTITAHLHDSQYHEDADAPPAAALLPHLDRLMEWPVMGTPVRRVGLERMVRCVHARGGTPYARADTLDAFLAAVQSDCPEEPAFDELPELIRLCAEGAHRLRSAPLGSGKAPGSR